MMKKIFVILIIIALAACSEEGGQRLGQVEANISLKDFFRNPDKSDVKISPDGSHISYLAPYKNRLNVFVQEIGKDTAVRITSETARDINNYLWAGNNKILYQKDNAGDENFSIFAANIDGSGSKALVSQKDACALFVDGMVYDDEILIALNKRDPKLDDVFRVNINTGRMKSAAVNPGNIQRFVPDHDGRIRMAFGADSCNSVLYYRDNENQQFRKVLNINYNDIFIPMIFTGDNKRIIASSNLGRDKQAIVEFDPVTSREAKVIYQNPDYDAAMLLYSFSRRTTLAVQYTSWKKEYYITDNAFKNIYSKLDKLLGDYEIVIADFSLDEKKFIIRTYSDKSLGAYYLWDEGTGKLDIICEVSPWINENSLSDMKPIEYMSRDSLVIHGYLTIPKGREAKNLPVVVRIHGGPWARDTWGFNPEAQFLASRGYAVFQMNFRGSVGYGRKFWEASFRQWGLKMADDVTDGVNWLISEGIADPNRIAVYGSSFGGYQALVSLVREPQLYACGISYVGISNLFTFTKSMPPSWMLVRNKIYAMVGNPVTDSAQFYATSPVFHTDRIRVPVFIAQGANDTRVKQAEAEQMVAALKKRGIPVRYMLKNDEGHGFMKEENRFDFYHTMEEFLAEHLK